MTSREFLRIVLTGSEDERRSLAASAFTNPEFIRRMVQQMPEESLDDLSQRFPATGFRWHRELIITALVGSAEEKERIWRRFFDGVVTFSQLVTHYSLTLPQVAEMGHVFDASSSTLVEQLRLMQRLEPLRAEILGTPATWDRDIAKKFGADYLASSRETIQSYALQHGFDAETAERRLREDQFRRLPYTCALSTWIQSYLARHKGTKHPRKPEVNDLRDLLHCMSAPYVDILVTDRFAADVTRRLAEKFGTRVVGSLKDLAQELPGTRDQVR